MTTLFCSFYDTLSVIFFTKWYNAASEELYFFPHLWTNTCSILCGNTSKCITKGVSERECILLVRIKISCGWWNFISRCSGFFFTFLECKMHLTGKDFVEKKVVVDETLFQNVQVSLCEMHLNGKDFVEKKGSGWWNLISRCSGFFLKYSAMLL